MGNGSKSYGAVIKSTRGKLGLSLAQLRKRMLDLGFEISPHRLEQIEYQGRKLNVLGVRRLAQIAETFREVAAEDGWTKIRIRAELSDHALFPEYFEAPAATAST